MEPMREWSHDQILLAASSDQSQIIISPNSIGLGHEPMRGESHDTNLCIIAQGWGLRLYFLRNCHKNNIGHLDKIQ